MSGGMKRSVLALAAAPLAALLAVAPAWASSAAHTRQVGSCRAQGDFAICSASGNVNHPLSLVVHVTSSPDQHISGAWDVVCGKGTGAGSKSGTLSGTTPFKRTVKMPYRRPDSCTVSADAQLGTGGKLHVWVIAWKR
jgi:hypothetical protein